MAKVSLLRVVSMETESRQSLELGIVAPRGMRDSLTIDMNLGYELATWKSVDDRVDDYGEE